MAAVVAAVIIVPMVFDPNDYKDEIKSLVEKETGRSWDLSGDIGLSIFPWLGFDLGPLTLGNAPGFPPDPFLKAERTRVHVALLPLLRKEIQMDTVTMTGLVVNLARDPAGKTNWDDLLAKTGGAKESKEAQPPAGSRRPPPGRARRLCARRHRSPRRRSDLGRSTEEESVTPSGDSISRPTRSNRVSPWTWSWAFRSWPPSPP